MSFLRNCFSKKEEKSKECSTAEPQAILRLPWALCCAKTVLSFYLKMPLEAVSLRADAVSTLTTLNVRLLCFLISTNISRLVESLKCKNVLARVDSLFPKEPFEMLPNL